jgi:hypothetical protein
MRQSSLGRWVVRLSVVAVLGIAVLAAAYRFTPNDVTWAASLVSTIAVAR